MSIDNKFSKDVVLYRGKDAVLKFIKCIFKEYSYCRDVMKKHFNKNLVMTAEQNEEFERTNICWICGKLTDIGDQKVTDHCHVTGGSSHWKCNINLKISKKLPVILSKFDCKISVIPNGLEKYMSFTLNGNIVFIDSMLFMNSNLAKLAKNLGSKDFKYLSEEFSGKKLQLVKKKGICPYEYFDSFKQFKESNLPNINCFFSSLKDCGISEKEYQRACGVWKVFGFKNLGEYHNFYLKTDELLLSDFLKSLLVFV